jgi:RluA family pseudouridine synthase
MERRRPGERPIDSQPDRPVLEEPVVRRPGLDRTPERPVGRPERRVVSGDALRDHSRDSRGGYRRGGHHLPGVPATAPLGPPTSYKPPPPTPKPEKQVVIADAGTSRVETALEEEARLERETRKKRALPGEHEKKPRPAKTRKEPALDPAQVCTIVYQDEDIVIVDKAAGYPVTPTGAFVQRSVMMSLAARGLSPLYPSSLLDPEATGLVALSRSEIAAQAMRWNWRSKLCKRQYLAVAQGDVIGGRGRIALPIGAVLRGKSIVHQVLPGDVGGRRAETEWKLLARGRGMSRLLVSIGAGRCHQIRIHLAAIGHPIVGDRLFGHTDNAMPLQQLLDVPSKYKDVPNLPPMQIALHCYKIEMPHPITQEEMTWTAPIPRALLALMPGAWVL